MALTLSGVQIIVPNIAYRWILRLGVYRIYTVAQNIAYRWSVVKWCTRTDYSSKLCFQMVLAASDVQSSSKIAYRWLWRLVMYRV